MTNPGQFFACCGLLELAHRIWPGAEGWFDWDKGMFHVHVSTDDDKRTIQSLMTRLTKAKVEGELSDAEKKEIQDLEFKKRKLKKEKNNLPKPEEERRVLLGKRQREGALLIGAPFMLRIAWWQEDGDDVPKTFAGRQEVLRMVAAMLSEVDRAAQNDRPLEYRCLLRVDSDDNRQRDAKVEPFYFDAARFAHALDAGFSLDVQDKSIRATAAPLTEFLALIGLQRFRPRQSSDSKWSFEYWAWTEALCPAVAAAVACGALTLPTLQGYRFTLRFRDDQKRYKAFDLAIPIGDDT